VGGAGRARARASAASPWASRRGGRARGGGGGRTAGAAVAGQSRDRARCERTRRASAREREAGRAGKKQGRTIGEASCETGARKGASVGRASGGMELGVVSGARLRGGRASQQTALDAGAAGGGASGAIAAAAHSALVGTREMPPAAPARAAAAADASRAAALHVGGTIGDGPELPLLLSCPVAPRSFAPRAPRRVQQPRQPPSASPGAELVWSSSSRVAQASPRTARSELASIPASSSSAAAAPQPRQARCLTRVLLECPAAGVAAGGKHHAWAGFKPFTKSYSPRAARPPLAEPYGAFRAPIVGHFRRAPAGRPDLLLSFDKVSRVCSLFLLCFALCASFALLRLTSL
jgi:hypothetical protein